MTSQADGAIPRAQQEKQLSSVVRVAVLVLATMAIGVLLFQKRPAPFQTGKTTFVYMDPAEQKAMRAKIFSSPARYQAWTRRLQALSRTHHISIALGWTTVHRGEAVERIAREKIEEIRRKLRGLPSTYQSENVLILVLLDTPRLFTVAGHGPVYNALSASVLYQPEFHYLQTRFIKDGADALFATVDFIDRHLKNINLFVKTSPIPPGVVLDFLVGASQSITQMLPGVLIEEIQRVIIAAKPVLVGNRQVLALFLALLIVYWIFTMLVPVLARKAIKQVLAKAGFRQTGGMADYALRFVIGGVLAAPSAALVVVVLFGNVINRVTLAQIAHIDFGLIWKISEVTRDIDLALPLFWRMALAYVMAVLMISALLELFHHIFRWAEGRNSDERPAAPGVAPGSYLIRFARWLAGASARAGNRTSLTLNLLSLALILAIVVLPSLLFFTVVPLEGPLATLFFVAVPFHAVNRLVTLGRKMLPTF